MIAEGRFQTQLNTVDVILGRVGLLEERNLFPNKGLGVGFFKDKSYRQVYEDCVREYSFDFRLVDQSLLLFLKNGRNVNDGGLSFSYYECPVKILPYKEFVGTQIDLSPFDEGFEESVAQFGDDLRADYEQYVSTTDSKNVVTPIRYDCKASDYKEGRHPASHVHFGFGNEIRVGTRRVMNPVSFILMVVRQCYPDCWDVLRGSQYANVWCRNVRESVDEVDGAFWNDGDKMEVALL
jgi:hypothetical protein